jgi:predicted DsbA family dithiol-disulfide isomerase
MIVDVFQDMVCPWCRIGKKNLFDGLEEWRQTHDEPVEIRYRAFLLDPSMPPEGRPFMEVMMNKMGSRERVQQIVNRVTEAGRAVGVPFDFGKVKKMPNTWASHALIKMAPKEMADEMVEAVFRAYFEEGRDIGNMAVLLELAREHGLDDRTVKESLEREEMNGAIKEDLRLAEQLGIRAVPFFILDGKLALSGAHSKETFLKALAEVAKG